jgi:hypothetical protein
MALPSLLLGILLFQGPGDGWALVPDARQVKKLYWDLFQTTEVWIRVIPEDPAGKPPLVSDDKTVDLTAPGAPYRYRYPCTPGEVCGANAVAAEIDQALLRSLITARVAKGEALGFPASCPRRTSGRSPSSPPGSA